MFRTADENLIWKSNLEGTRNLIAAANPSVAARCNVNKCRPESMAKAGFSAVGHFDEMKRSLFCIVPPGDSPPSSRLYLAVAAGCIPVLLSDEYEGFAPSAVPWRSLSLRFAEARMLGRQPPAPEARGALGGAPPAAAAGPRAQETGRGRRPTRRDARERPDRERDARADVKP